MAEELTAEQLAALSPAQLVMLYPDGITGERRARQPVGRSFAGAVDEERAEFLSYREAMNKLATFSGESVGKIAQALKQAEFHGIGAALLVGVEQSFRATRDGLTVAALLDQTILDGQIPTASVSSWLGNGIVSADVDKDGWLRTAFITRLRAKGLPCPESLTDPRTMESTQPSQAVTGSQSADWAHSLRGMASLRLWEAASVLAGIDPYEPEPDFGSRDPYESAEIHRCKRILITAIDAGELPNNGWGASRDEQEIPHPQLRAWCRKYGYTWPIPEAIALPATDSELVEGLRTAQLEIANLKQQLAAAGDIAAERDTLQQEILDNLTHIDDLKWKLESATSAPVVEAEKRETELDEARQEIERLKALVAPRPDFLIPIVIAVQNEFWANWDESKPRPKAVEEIQPWISKNFPQISSSNALIQAVEKVACPFNRDPSAKK
jgi:hypothetical protein